MGAGIAYEGDRDNLPNGESFVNILEPIVNIPPRSKEKCFNNIVWEDDKAGIASSNRFYNEYLEGFSLKDEISRSYGSAITDS